MLSAKLFFQERKFFAPAFMYASFALVFSTWIIYIPFIVEKLQISEGKLGVALFMASLGSLVMIPASNKLTDYLGVGCQAFWGFILYGTSLYGIFFASNYTWLIIALFYYGMTSAVFSIALNAMVAEIEKQAGKYIMTGTHGFWSIGGIIGASLGSFVAGKFNMPLVHITVLLLVLITVQAGLRKEYFNVKSTVRVKSVRRSFPFKPLAIIASIAMLMMASEGAIADWSGLYLKHVVAMAAQYLGLGYAFFSGGMALGRFTGDALSYRFGSWKLLSFAMATSLLGFGLVLTTVALVAFIGFFVIGLGFSIIVPELYRLASNIEGVRAADGISIIAATSNIGMLAGPAILGFIAEVYGLFFSFVALSCFVLSALVLTTVRKG
jgi:MFS family permease